MASDEDYTRVELLGCTNCEFEVKASETALFEHLKCQNCGNGSLKTRYEFPDTDREICSCGRAPVAEDMMLGIDCTKCLSEDFCPLP